jgi:DNA repair protein RadC
LDQLHQPQKNPDIGGHRRRTRDKVIDKSAATLTKLELLEMILYPSNPRRDSKPMAKRLMRELDSLAGVLRAPVETLQQLDQVGPAAIAAIKVTEAAEFHLSHSRIKNQSVLRNWVDVQDYCINRLAHERRGHFIIICLDNQNRLFCCIIILVVSSNRHAPILMSHAISKRRWR